MMLDSEILAQIQEWTETHEGGINPLHEVADQSKFEALKTSMDEDGWIGAPLVVDGDQALTGSHRYWAAIETFTEIPRIDIADLCDVCDIDWDAHRAEYPDSIEAYIAIADVLPADVVAYLGMDLH